ncbi:3-oxoacyl-(acyl carrier protein) synthase II [Gloeomargarita lithophora Alchichica-D10]|uniref:3-oxoacyl-(Acyl carrier protein) synthase II n=1 Tax=Gloeomargarita lithophora Alchichica-D10 TaxID=1188229 RepID=A0A1J0AHB9_9CYAN|nr:beta-ketoacyl synthase N-terminal-like domain-containing protein [Gloeomargarita lithophora]APB35334.1 3-oxoacyl-(acyl carrier protein) synthase II [Gloeomargarita lithophora Alchichica-D10]
MVQVVGMGLVSALGKNKHTCWQNLLADHASIALQQPFPMISPLPLAMLEGKPSDPTTLLLTALTEALHESEWELPLSDCGVVIGSSRGEQYLWEQWLAHERNDYHLLVEHLPGSFARTVATKIGTKSLVSAPMAACATGVWAVATGVEWLRRGQCSRVIVGAVDTPITPLTLAGFRQMGALAKDGCFPFDQERQGLVLGEAAGVILLENQKKSIQKYGSILGWGTTCDAENLVISSVDLEPAITAIENCFKYNNVSLDKCHVVHTHGTGTIIGDHREMQIIQKLFPDDISILATKGATGHTLGASGIVNIIFSLLALKNQILPPCTGLNMPDFSGNFIRKKQQVKLDSILNLSFGFGGQNGAILVGNSEV